MVFQGIYVPYSRIWKGNLRMMNRKNVVGREEEDRDDRVVL